MFLFLVFLFSFYFLILGDVRDTVVASLSNDDEGSDNVATGNPGSVIAPQYGSSKIRVFVWRKNTILKFVGNAK